MSVVSCRQERGNRSRHTFGVTTWLERPGCQGETPVSAASSPVDRRRQNFPLRDANGRLWPYGSHFAAEFERQQLV